MTSINYFERLENLLKAKNYSKRTIQNYNSCLKKFLNEFKGNVQRATVAELTAYIATVNTSRSAMAQMYGTLQNFYKYVLKQPKKFPFIPYPKNEQRLQNIPTHNQILEMIELTENVKHKLIISLFYGTGIRVEELINLKWIDVIRTEEINPLVIHVKGKGNKDRLVPLSENLYSKLKDYCKEYNLKCDTNKQHYIFGGVEPYSIRSAQMVVFRAGEMADIPFKVTPHKLRHAYAIYLHHELGYDLITVGKLLGHESNSTTMLYAKYKPESIVTPI